MIDLKQLQKRIGVWAVLNFGHSDRSTLHCTLGVCEEAGELAHAILKRSQGIRGTREEHDAEAQDAVADIVIYLLDLCHREGWDFEGILAWTAAKVLKRDWVSDPASGEVSRG